jgi:hypothetical protein
MLRIVRRLRLEVGRGVLAELDLTRLTGTVRPTRETGATRSRPYGQRPAAVPAAGSTGRFVTGGLDLEQKQWAAILRLVKLEPLKEP